MDTDAIFIPTSKMRDDMSYYEATSRLSDYEEYTQNRWEATIELSGDYQLNSSYNVSTPQVELNDPDGTSDALDQAQSWIETNEGGLFSNYDSIIVCDTRSFSSGSTIKLGRAYIGTAGGNHGVGYLTDDAESDSACHELLHIYGGRHADEASEDSTFYSSDRDSSCSILGRPNQYDCSSEQNDLPRGDYIGSCTSNTARDTVESIN